MTAHCLMLLLLPLLLLGARAEHVRVEYTNTLNLDDLKNATFCQAVAELLQGSADCTSFVALAQDGIRVAAMQVDVDDAKRAPLTPGNVAELNVLLRNASFFTLPQSAVTLVTRVSNMRTALIVYCGVATVFMVVTVLWFRMHAVTLPPRAITGSLGPLRRQVRP